MLAAFIYLAVLPLASIAIRGALIAFQERFEVLPALPEPEATAPLPRRSR
jgi:hypothetical protein